MDGTNLIRVDDAEYCLDLLQTGGGWGQDAEGRENKF